MADFSFGGLLGQALSGAAGGVGAISDKVGQVIGTLDFDATKLSGQGLKAIAATDNMNYVMRLYELNSPSGLEVSCPAPRTFKIGMENQWTDVMTMVRDALGGSANGAGSAMAAALKLGQQYSGTYFMPRQLTLQVWQGSPPMRFQIPMSFNAINSAREDVVNPIRSLIQMAAPKRGNNNLLRAPGPSLNEVMEGKGDLSKVKHLLGLRIGRSVNLLGLLIDSVDVEWESRCDKDGIPIAAEVVVGLRTYWTFHQDEYVTSFFGG